MHAFASLLGSHEKDVGRMILLIVAAIVALLIAVGCAFGSHCESRFDTDVFSVTNVLTNFAGWGLVVAGSAPVTINIVLVVAGVVILGFQIFRLIARTSLFHGLVAFTLLSVLCAAVVFVIALLVSAASSGSKRRVVILD